MVTVTRRKNPSTEADPDMTKIMEYAEKNL